ncbi:hypothetical protein BDZ85DRAFT_191534, partial [Elsinoe ampelina]
MVAAAYAKTLLLRIAPDRVEQSETMNSIMRSCMSNEDRLQSKWRSWLSPVDPSTNFSKACSLRHGSSGNWLIHGEAFTRWRAQPGSFLWLYGMAGCGKTVLSSTILSHLSNNGDDWNKILYFYFDFADVGKQTLSATVRTLLYQLSRHNENHANAISDLWQKHDYGHRQPSLEQLCQLLQACIASEKELWIVIDAVDECTRDGSADREVLSWLEKVHHGSRNVHLLMTSRPESDIETSVKTWAQPESVLPIQSDSVAKDIDAYIHSTIATRPDLHRWHKRPDAQQLIRQKLSEKAGGMFRWVACQIETIVDCISYQQLEWALSHLPKGLYETYDRMVSRIKESDREVAFRILRFLIYSERPMSLEEAADLLLVDTEQSVLRDKNRYRLPKTEEIIQFCPGLVAIVPSTTEASSAVEASSSKTGRLLQLAHFSVQEYFRSNRIDAVISAAFESQESLRCLTLVYDAFSDTPEVDTAFPLARYCARYWTVYGRGLLNVDKEVQSLADLLFEPEVMYERWLKLYDPDRPWAETPESGNRKDALYCAAATGLLWKSKLLIEKGANVNAEGGYHGNALQAAAFRGHEAVIKLLIEKGAKVSA